MIGEQQCWTAFARFSKGMRPGPKAGTTRTSCEAAHQDGDFDAEERRTIEALLEARLSLTAQEARELVELADAQVQDKADLWSFARVVKNRFDHDERVHMMEMLWEVAYADGVLHDYEAGLMRRLAGLVYVSDAESGQARKRVLERLGLSNDT